MVMLFVALVVGDFAGVVAAAKSTHTNPNPNPNTQQSDRKNSVRRARGLVQQASIGGDQWPTLVEQNNDNNNNKASNERGTQRRRE